MPPSATVLAVTREVGRRLLVVLHHAILCDDCVDFNRRSVTTIARVEESGLVPRGGGGD
jgi:hypothetical protein